MTKRILIVDDEPTSLKIAQEACESGGYEAITAQDGLDALVKIKKQAPDLVVLDVMMPEINGYDVCYQLRFNKDFQQLPIVLMTVRDQELSADIGERVNIDYLQKPFDQEVLLQKIAALLSH